MFAMLREKGHNDIGLIFDPETRTRKGNQLDFLKVCKDQEFPHTVFWCGMGGGYSLKKVGRVKMFPYGTWVYNDALGLTPEHGDDQSTATALKVCQESWSLKKQRAGTRMVQQRLNKKLDRNLEEPGGGFPTLRPDAKFFNVDLRTAANETHLDDRPWDGKGWMDWGPEHDLRRLPTGNQTFAGVPFDIIDPATNGGRSVVMISNERDLERMSHVPRDVAIDIGRKVGGLSVLRTLIVREPLMDTVTAGTAEQFGLLQIWPHYRIEYEDGTFISWYAFRGAGDASLPKWGRWDSNGVWSLSKMKFFDPNVLTAWMGFSRSGDHANLLMHQWQNPYPEKVVARLRVRYDDNDMRSDCSEAVMAITGAEPTDADIAFWKTERKRDLRHRAGQLSRLDKPLGRPLFAPEGEVVVQPTQATRPHHVGARFWPPKASDLFDATTNFHWRLGNEPFVISNAIDYEFLDRIEREDIRPDLKLPATSPIVYIPSAGSIYKGMRYVVALVRSLAARYNNEIGFYLSGVNNRTLKKQLDALTPPVRYLFPGTIPYARNIARVTFH